MAKQKKEYHVSLSADELAALKQGLEDSGRNEIDDDTASSICQAFVQAVSRGETPNRSEIAKQHGCTTTTVRNVVERVLGLS